MSIAKQLQIYCPFQELFTNSTILASSSHSQRKLSLSAGSGPDTTLETSQIEATTEKKKKKKKAKHDDENGAAAEEVAEEEPKKEKKKKKKKVQESDDE